MKRTVAFIVMLLCAHVVYGQESVWFQGSFEEAKAQAQKEDKLILIDFFSDG